MFTANMKQRIFLISSASSRAFRLLRKTILIVVFPLNSNFMEAHVGLKAILNINIQPSIYGGEFSSPTKKLQQRTHWEGKGEAERMTNVESYKVSDAAWLKRWQTEVNKKHQILQKMKITGELNSKKIVLF